MMTLAMLGCTAVVVLGLIGLVIRFDPALRVRQHRVERHIRRETAALLREADRALREHAG